MSLSFHGYITNDSITTPWSIPSLISFKWLLLYLITLATEDICKSAHSRNQFNSLIGLNRVLKLCKRNLRKWFYKAKGLPNSPYPKMLRSLSIGMWNMPTWELPQTTLVFLGNVIENYWIRGFHGNGSGIKHLMLNSFNIILQAQGFLF